MVLLELCRLIERLTGAIEQKIFLGRQPDTGK